MYSSGCFSWTSQPPKPLQQPTTGEEEAQIEDRVHQSPNLRTGETLPVPEVLEPRGPRRDRGPVGPKQRPGHHVVPKQKSETQKGHGGTEEGRRIHQNPHSSQILFGKRTRPGHSEEKIFRDSRYDGG